MSPEERCTAADLMDFLSHSPKNGRKNKKKVSEGSAEHEHFMKENQQEEKKWVSTGGREKKQIR